MIFAEVYKESCDFREMTPDFIIRMSKMCDDRFTVQDLKNFLYQFLRRLNESKGCENGITYKKLKNITCKKFGLKKIDFTKGVRFTRKGKEELARLQQDFEECLENMKKVAKGEIKIL